MPRVYRMLRVAEVRAEARRHAELGLHIGVDLTDPGDIFGPGWDRDARDLSRLLKSLGRHALARGPGGELPLGAREPYVQDHVRVCHERALAAAMHMGCEHYLVRLGPLHGLARSERLARCDRAARVLVELAARAHTRGLRLHLQHQLETDLESLGRLADGIRAGGGGLIFSPARALWAGLHGVNHFLDGLGPVLQGVDLSDLAGEDLEPRPPGKGLLGDWVGLPDLLQRPSLQFCIVELPVSATDELVAALNALVRSDRPVPVSA